MGVGGLGKEFPEVIHGVTVSAGSGIGRNAEDFGDAGKGEVFPELEMNDGALFLRKIRQGLGNALRMGWGVRRQEWVDVRRIEEFFIGAHSTGAAGAAADEVGVAIAGGPEKIGFGILEADMGLADQLDEKILEEVVGVGFGTAQAEEETIERRCMGIVESGDGIGGHARKELGDGEEQVSTG